MKKILYLVTLIVASPEISWAYIDPGSGMAFASGILAWIAGFFVLCFGFISLTFKKWVHFFKNLFSRNKNKK